MNTHCYPYRFHRLFPFIRFEKSFRQEREEEKKVFHRSSWPLLRSDYDHILMRATAIFSQESMAPTAESGGEIERAREHEKLII